MCSAQHWPASNRCREPDRILSRLAALVCDIVARLHSYCFAAAWCGNMLKGKVRYYLSNIVVLECPASN